MSSIHEALEAALADPPIVHVDDVDGTATTFGLLPAALRWILETVDARHRTLETGCGLSTIAFALTGAEHRCVVPAASEPERIRAYCAEHDISLERCEFIVARSEEYLPVATDLGPLDLVLIDGSHSFPQVFIDWFYVAGDLRVGGHVIVDDTHVWTGHLLRDVLAAEQEWAIAQEWFGRSVALRKIAETDRDKLWLDQPYVAARSSTVHQRARTASDLVRAGAWDELRVKGASALGRVRQRLVP
jgi:predicted O-methyltransferase YrrM